MIDDFNPQSPNEQSSSTWTPLPFATPIPDFARLEKKSKKGKRGKKRRGSKKAQRLHLEAERNKLIWQNGYLSKENDMLKYMIVLATAADRRRVNTEIVDSGIKLLGKGGR